MKSPKKTDRRFVLQLALIGVLTVLPVTMIAVNGASAIRAILSSPSNGDTTDVEPRKAPRKEITTKNTPLLFGVYDPGNIFAGDKDLKLRHIYISWASIQKKELSEKLISLETQGYNPLLTVEPWPLSGAKKPLLSGIVQGEYDGIIDSLAKILSELKGPLYLSWGHEMDQDLTERYPWSGKDPREYVAAYCYVVDAIRAKVDVELHWIWAGVLKQGSLRYWPGDKYADFIGMPIYSFPEWDRQTYGFIRDFCTTFEEKQKIVRRLKKPLIITELGVSGSSDFETFWIHQAFLSLKNYPNLAGVIFFHAKDTEGAWGDDIKTPDWRIHPEAVRSLVKWKLQ